MIVGVPRERKTLEKRVALTPDGARELVRDGHTVKIEIGAGLGSHFDDDAYRAAGAAIVGSLKEVWNGSDLVVKVKEPDAAEFEFFRPGLTLFCFLHLASLPEVAAALIKSGVDSLAYELVQTDDGRFPLLEPMSEVAGKLAVVNGASYLLSQNGGRGILLGGTIGVAPATVAVIGAGIAGRAAAEVAVGMGARTTVLDIDSRKLETVKSYFGNTVTALYSNEGALSRLTAESDLVIGAVLIPGAKAPHLIKKSMVQGMKPGAVIVDISIDQGGCVETMRPTTLDNPVYEAHGVIHYGVCNMPAQTPLTSTLALTSRTFRYVKKIVDGPNWVADEALRLSVNTKGGKLVNQAVGESLGLAWQPI